MQVPRVRSVNKERQADVACQRPKCKTMGESKSESEAPGGRDRGLDKLERCKGTTAHLGLFRDVTAEKPMSHTT